ncbi:P-loop containing nucleoside triphosphate hydrolase protein [Aspergillus candidus]|uniref:P-loop containing nucleoside triphosphate hydrolase protein n=1 Tax=Aspergillus candidus TaxID=41067 RepID=A0A2I2FNE8_ASPCN|nr:P-loop containing nucleoside triphosphate hydrolase protein [Aspergillus candidus]PLB42134.1 P-loop containing nucleoside triphosphate hydrolase protein [Aspergillus candidus]
MNSVERLRYFGVELEEKAPLHTIDVRESWPEKGEIVFNDVAIRYRKNLPLVLQGLSLHNKGGERIGVVGRTSAGKSLITDALFRPVEISAGSITIDGVNISRIGLLGLRSRTIRSNLDPFHEHTDLALWSALRKTGLIRAGADDTKLEDRKDDTAPALLMALARALVRDTRIVICDEATSSVDMETDDKIQLAMVSGFRGKTLLCIAHRLRTIIGYDRICVVDAGQIAQFDTPANLYCEEGGIFRGMCERSSIRLEDIESARDTITTFDDTNRR